MRIEYGISNCAEKKVKTRPYSILIQKSKDSSAFDEQKVKNIPIAYRFFPTLDAALGFDFMHFLISISGWGRVVVIE